MSTTLGVTFACLRDFSARFALATTDEQIVREEMIRAMAVETADINMMPRPGNLAYKT